MPKADVLSKTEFAKRVGLTPARISQLISEGLPVRMDGKVNTTKAEAWINDNLDPRRREAAGRPPSPVSGTIVDLRAAKLEKENALLELELRRRRSELIDRDEVEAAIFARARFERDAWIGWVARTAPALAYELNTDAAATFSTLDRLVREHFAELAATPLRVGDD